MIILGYISFLSVLIPILVFATSHSVIRSKFPALLLIEISLIVSFTSDLISLVASRLHMSNLTMGNCYAVVTFLLMTMFYVKLMPTNRRTIIAFTMIFIIFFILNTAFLQPITELQGYTRSVSAVLLLSNSILYFSQLLKSLPSTNITSYGPFWINVGVLFYFSLNLFVFIFSNFVFTHLSAELINIFWGFHNVSNILKNILFAIGINLAGPRAYDGYRSRMLPGGHKTKEVSQPSSKEIVGKTEIYNL